MVYSIIYIVMWIISVLFTADLFESILKCIYNVKTQNDVSKINAIIIKGDQENIEYTVRRILFIYSLNFENYNLCIVYSNLSVDNETKKICNIISRNFDYVKFINI